MCRLIAVWMGLALAIGSGGSELPETGRSKLCINPGWRFHLGDPDQPLYDADLDDTDWAEVHVPHTLKLTSLALDGCEDDKMQTTFHRMVGWYRKDLHITDDRDTRVFLEFEGVHQVTDVWVNGRHAGQHSVGGYTPFHLDISGLVTRGETNQITVRADNRVRQDVPPDPGPFDYIKFSGLYRDVYVVETDPMHITFNWEALDAGLFITTPVVDPVLGNAVIDVKTVVRNQYPQDRTAKVVTRVADDRGVVVLKMQQELDIPAGSDRVFKQIGAIEDNLHLWSVSHPYLYRVISSVEMDGKTVDVLENNLGIRQFELDPVRGFVLNGEPIELVGFNRHQHYGYIGDALPDSLHYKDMRQFKELGLNIVRTAHYPQDDALLDACDELGILVYEEAPTWISISQDPQWYKNLDAATRVMIRNHRNHPSVVIWGAGINHRGYVPGSVLACKQEDPTRLTASQSSRWTGWQTSGLSDIFANMMYGGGIWDRSEPLLAMEGGRGAKVIAEYNRDPLKTGMISWTAHAYYTFHLGAHLEDRTRSGMMTVFRQPKRGVMWYPSELTDTPFLHVEDAWSPDTETVTVYSNAEEVELAVNGRPMMRQGPSEDPAYEGLDHPPFHFQIEAFEPGILEARGISHGAIVVSQTLHTPETPLRIEIILDHEGRAFVANGSDILVGHAQIVDGNGTLCREAGHTIRFAVDGPGSIVGDGANIGANPIAARNGRAPILVRAGTTPGTLTISATADGLGPGTATATTTPWNPDVIASRTRPVYDLESIRVDLGAEDQLLQFDWVPWNGRDPRRSIRQLDAFGGVAASLSTGSPDGILRWLGEMNVIGKYGFAYGEGVVAIDPEGVFLEFQTLPEGRYRLRTWHHAPRSNTDSMDPNRERLKSLSAHKVPHARHLEITVFDADGNARSQTPVTEGKEMQFQPVAVSTCLLRSDGIQPVRIQFKDREGSRGIWVNAFELGQWHEDLDPSGT